ncbi:MAG: fatty acid--CoA ligase family protein [Xanthobacteraceae bacterium]
MVHAEAPSLRRYLVEAPAAAFVADEAGQVRLADLLGGTCLRGHLAQLSGRSVLVATASQRAAALALIELDGVARRLLILPPDVDRAHLPELIAEAEIDAAVVDSETDRARLGVAECVVCSERIVPAIAGASAPQRSEWLLLTSGTTGVPKLVVHNLASLATAIAPQTQSEPMVWGTFYDIRRYGGLQIFLRAILGGASLVFSCAGEPIAGHLQRLARHGVTHLSGTPSHWRRALMSPHIGTISPRYVRLSGEIADQAILDSLRAAFPAAAIGHAYASTEAGVGFAVDDGCAGFPAAYLEGVGKSVEIKVVDGSLRIRSPGTASRYAGARGVALFDSEGFVDTGDMVERRGERCYFIGRKGGIINIGGLKVHPEEIEAVINRHPRVRMSLVRSKRSPVTGAIAIADVVLKSACADVRGESAVKDEILQLCRGALARHKVPAAISFVPALSVAATGKLARRS